MLRWRGNLHQNDSLKAVAVCLVLFLVKFILFDVVWCYSSSFSSFSYPTTYLSKILIALILTLPFIFRLPYWVIVAEAVMTDLLLVANLMYFRTYYTVIPSDSYLLAGNLLDFMGSVRDQVRLCDFIFPLTTIVAAVCLHSKRSVRLSSYVRKIYLIAICGCAALIYLIMLAQGGFRQSYGSMLTHRQMSATPTYSLFGTLIYEALDSKPEMTSEMTARIETFLALSANKTMLAESFATPRTIVVVLLESFESWLLEQEVEGVEITPNLNRYLRESSTLYVPNVLSQVKGGRSIDAQLLLMTGLLPIHDGCFSSRYPYSTYLTLIDAVREHCGELCAYAFTPDKHTTWNQMIVSPQFGFNRLFSRDDFSRDVLTGNGGRRRLADGPFLAECFEKIRDIGRSDESVRLWLQCITYSGHSPFIIPDELKHIRFSDEIPSRMNDYMTAANYTDCALGKFIDGLRSESRFADAIFIIIGDHEGLASDRAALVASKAGAGVVCEYTGIGIILRFRKAASWRLG